LLPWPLLAICCRLRSQKKAFSAHRRGVQKAPSQPAVDRNGQQKFQKDFSVKGLRPPKAALRALDRKILLKHTAAIAIDGSL